MKHHHTQLSSVKFCVLRGTPLKNFHYRNVEYTIRWKEKDRCCWEGKNGDWIEFKNGRMHWYKCWITDDEISSNIKKLEEATEKIEELHIEAEEIRRKLHRYGQKAAAPERIFGAILEGKGHCKLSKEDKKL